jgi:archaellum component FlaG (FlaF/FlaG flagellin family)
MVAILIVAAVAGAVALSSAMSNLPWSNWTDSEAQMTVQTCTPGNATAPEGKQYVTVTAWVQNLGHDSLTLTPGRFLLLTGEGGYYSGTYDVPSQMPGTLSKGEGAAATVGFLIPADETPASLRLIIIEDLLSHVDASIPA